MGLSSKKQKTKSTETIAPSTYSMPYINDAASVLRPGFDEAQAQVRTHLPKITQGIDYYSDVLGGKFMNGNPYLDAMISRSNEGINDNVSSMFSGAGRYGSGAHQGVLARAIADNENQYRFQNYATERGYLDAAPQNMAGMVTKAVTLPQLPGSQYADQINALMGKYATSTGSSTTKQSGGLGSSLLGLAGAGLSGWASGGFKL